MLWWIISLSKKDSLQEKKTMVLLISAGVFILCAFVFFVLCIKLINFMCSPNLEKSAKATIPIPEENEYLKVFVNGTNFYYQANIPEMNVMDAEPNQFSWDKFKKCSGKGAQTRIQSDVLKVEGLNFIVFLHINKSDFLFGLVTDKGVYFDVKTQAIICQTRIGHSSEGSKTDLKRECAISVYNCFNEAKITPTMVESE